jgi:hypothetical protein
LSLFNGDLTTPQRVAMWLPSPPALPSPILSMLVTSASNQIRSKLNRNVIYSRLVNQTLGGTGNDVILLPEYPVSSISSLQVGHSLVNAYPLPAPTSLAPPNTFGYGYRFTPWDGVTLPGDPAMIKFVHGGFPYGEQNIKVSYMAGYGITNEAQVAAAQVTVAQPLGIWCRDNGVVYATTGLPLTAVATSPAIGQYVPPTDTQPGIYTFSAADAAANAALLISYSFVPADLEQAVIHMVAETMSYRGRVGEISKSLGGQESVRFWRGDKGMRIPPEIEALIHPYVSVIPPLIGSMV